MYIIWQVLLPYFIVTFSNIHQSCKNLTENAHMPTAWIL